MRVLLRNIRTDQFYAGRDKWVTRASQAQDFHDAQRAIRLAAERKLEGVELVLTYDNTGGEVVLPIQGQEKA